MYFETLSNKISKIYYEKFFKFKKILEILRTDVEISIHFPENILGRFFYEIYF